MSSTIETVQSWKDRMRVQGLPTGQGSTVLWFAGLDYLSHLLRADRKNTPYGLGNMSSSSASWLRHGLEPFRTAIAEYSQDRLPEFQTMAEELPSMRRRRCVTVTGADGDDLDAELYAQALGDREDVSKAGIWESEARPDDRRKPALNILFDGCVNSGERSGTFMIERQKQAYQTCIQAEQEGRPVRVIAAMPVRYDALRGHSLVVYIVVKDWTDPVFPALWGAFHRNETANSVACLQSLFILGTGEAGLGVPCARNAALDFQDGEEVFLLGGSTRVTYSPAALAGEEN